MSDTERTRVSPVPAHEAAALQTFLRADPHARRALAPAVYRSVGAERLDTIIETVLRTTGHRPRLRVVDGQLVVCGHRGKRARFGAWVQVRDERITGLILRRTRWPGATTRGLGPMLLSILAGQLVIYLVLVAGALVATTLYDWSGPAVVALCLLVLFRINASPLQWVVPAWTRWMLWLLAAALITRGALLATRAMTPTLDWPTTLVAATAVTLWWCLRRAGSLPATSVLLDLPVAEGDWYILQGGGRATNHHWRVPDQRGAIDLIRLARNGSRARIPLSRDLRDYAAYGTPVLAPCDGVVTSTANDLPDQTPLHPRTAPPAGNHIRIFTGQETILLAHLAPGSIRVTTGDRVQRGQLIGSVGNSGNTSEPHLHLHAEHNGTPLRLRLRNHGGPLVRGRHLRPASPPRADHSEPAPPEETGQPG